MIRFVYDGLYVASDDDDFTAIETWDGAVLCVGHVPCSVMPQLTLDVSPDDPLDEVIIHDAVAFIAESHAAGRNVLVVAEAGEMFAAVFPLAFLIGHHGKTFPDAFVSVSSRAALWPPPVFWLMSVVACYDLPFSEDDIFDEYLPMQMVMHTTQSLHAVQEGIYLGGIHALVNVDETLAAGIQAVLRVDNTSREQIQWPGSVDLLDLPISDAQAVDPATLYRGADFIAEQVAANRRVLVHCQEGVSRSVTMVMAYLIAHRSLSLAQAYRRIVFQRPVARPHAALLWSLVQAYNLPYSYEEVLHPLFLHALEQVLPAE